MYTSILFLTLILAKLSLSCDEVCLANAIHGSVCTPMRSLATNKKTGKYCISVSIETVYSCFNNNIPVICGQVSYPPKCTGRIAKSREPVYKITIYPESGWMVNNSEIWLGVNKSKVPLPEDFPFLCTYNQRTVCYTYIPLSCAFDKYVDSLKYCGTIIYNSIRAVFEKNSFYDESEGYGNYSGPTSYNHTMTLCGSNCPCNTNTPTQVPSNPPTFRCFTNESCNSGADICASVGCFNSIYVNNTCGKYDNSGVFVPNIFFTRDTPSDCYNNTGNCTNCFVEEVCIDSRFDVCNTTKCCPSECGQCGIIDTGDARICECVSPGDTNF